MDELKLVIQKHLCLSDEILAEVLKAIQEAGADNLDDAREFVMEKDLTGILKPIQIRKLLKRWSEPDSEPGVQAVTAVDHLRPRTSVPHFADASWPLNLDLSLDSLEFEVKNDMDSQQRLLGKKRKTLVRHVLSQIHKVTKKPRKKELSIIASRIHALFPKAINDHMDENMIGTGYDTFLNQLINRNDNFDRKKENPLQNSKDSLQVILPLDAERDAYGCVNWKPKLTQEERLAAAAMRDAFVDGTNLAEFMSATFKLQRDDMSSKTVSAVLSEWPMLKHSLAIISHFEELTRISLNATLKAKIIAFSGRLINFATSEDSREAQKSFAIYQEMLETKNFTGCHEGSYLGVIWLLMLQLKEDVETLLPLVDELVLPCELPLQETTRPILYVFGTSLLQARRAVLAFNQQVVCEVQSLLDGLATLFASYYVFNYEYPRAACATLEFVQRYFAGLNPKPTSQRRRSAVHPRVLKFTAAVSDHEWRAGIEDRRSVFNS